jgi:hypothetical protein
MRNAHHFLELNVQIFWMRILVRIQSQRHAHHFLELNVQIFWMRIFLNFEPQKRPHTTQPQ